MTTNDPVWAPQACTLPTAKRPVRVAEFDELFATGLRGQQRLDFPFQRRVARAGGQNHISAIIQRELIGTH